MFIIHHFSNSSPFWLILTLCRNVFLLQKEQVEDRLKFYETGELPKKNLEVMNEAMAAVKEETASFQLSRKEKKKNKKSKRKADEMEAETEEIVKELVENENPKKKKQKV